MGRVLCVVKLMIGQRYDRPYYSFISGVILNPQKNTRIYRGMALKNKVGKKKWKISDIAFI